MNQDLLVEGLAPNQYLDARNLRLADTAGISLPFSSSVPGTTLTSETGRQQKLVTIHGDTKYFELPDIPESTHKYGCGETDFYVIPAQIDLVIIGWFATPNELILITTSRNNLEPPAFAFRPDGSQIDVAQDRFVYPPMVPALGWYLPSVSQVWRIDISNQEAGALIITADAGGFGASNLKYNDYLNHYVSKQCDVSYIVESDCSKRVFWTDGYNRPYNLDISGDNCIINTDPRLLFFNPIVGYGNVLFMGYGNGTLPEGVYQYSYRYVTKDGTTTPWFPFTRPVILPGNNNLESYTETDGKDLEKPTSRSILLLIKDIDINYEQIEVLYAYSIAKDAILEQNIFERRDISGLKNCSTNPNGSPLTMFFTHSANGDRFGAAISLDEVVLPRFVVESAKSLTIANNRIHLSHFCESTQVRVDTEKVGWNFIGNGNFPPPHGFVLPADPLNSGLPYMYSDENEGVTDLDHKVPVGHNRFSGYVGAAGFVAPGVPPATNNLAITGNLFPEFKNDFLDYKGGWSNYYRRGYWRDEYYRFAIVLHYKDGTWGFADRIWDRGTGYDIKFPTINDYPLTYFDNVGLDWYKLNLGIRFTDIDLSSVAHLIKGFSIIRAPRTDQDKTIRCEGVVTNLYREVIDGKTLYLPFSNILQNGNGNGQFIDTHPQNRLTDNRTAWLLSPELDFAKATLDAGDTIGIDYQLFGKLTQNNTNPSIPFGVNVYAKAYKFLLNPFRVSKLVETAKWFDVGEEGYIYTNSGDIISINLNIVLTTLTLTADLAILGAGTAIVLKEAFGTLNQVYDYTENIPDNTAPNNDDTKWNYFIARIDRKPDQIYGGNDATGVANTRYIPTGHYQKVDEKNRGKNGAYLFDADVFGGDTFIDFYSRITSFNNNGDDVPTNSTVQQSSIMFPVQTTVNTDLRFEQKNDSEKVVKAVMEKHLTVDNFDILGMARHGASAPTDLQGEAFLQSDVYNKDESAWFYAGRPANFDETAACSTCFPAQIVASKERTFGEQYNSWTQILANERAELDLKFGGITELKTLSHEARLLVFWQENGGFGLVPVDNQSLKISTTAEAVLGTGRLYGQHRYLSETVGCRHKEGILRTDNGFYWYDANTKGFYFSNGNGEPKNLGEENGMANWFINHTPGINNLDNPIYKGGINLGWDYWHGDIMICYHAPLAPANNDLVGTPNLDWTLVYNESAAAFIAFYSFYPRMCMDLSGSRLLTPNPTYLAFNKDVRLLFSAPECNLFYDKQDENDSAYILFAVNQKHELTKEPGFLFMYTNRLWKRVEVLNNPQVDRYGGFYQTRCLMMTDTLFQARGGKFEGPIPLGTDLLRDNNPNWQTNSVLQRIMGEQIFVKLSANVITYPGGQRLFDYNEYDIHAAETFYAVSKRNT